MTTSNKSSEAVTIPTIRMYDPDAPLKLKDVCEGVGFFYREFSLSFRDEFFDGISLDEI